MASNVRECAVPDAPGSVDATHAADERAEQGREAS
jgi:hypothetical protein